MENNLYILQAPADLQYILHFLDKNITPSTILILKYPKLKSLLEQHLIDKQVRVLSFESSQPKHFEIFKLIKFKRSLNDLLLNELNNSYENVFFFSKYYDYPTAYIVSKLSNSSKNIYYFDHYDSLSVKDNPSRKFNITSKIKYRWICLTIFLLFRVEFKSIYRNKPLEWVFNSNKIKYISNNITPSFKKINLNIEPNSILVLMSQAELDMLSIKGRIDLSQLLDQLKSLKKPIIIKGHPRTGTPNLLYSYANFEIENYIPIEVVELLNVNTIFGIITTALACHKDLKKIKRISFIDLLQFKDEIRKKFFKRYLINLGKEHDLDINFEFKNSNS